MPLTHLMSNARERLINRYYDPVTGQFMGVDPMVGQTGTPFSYVSDDGINSVDFLGLKGWYCMMGGVSAYYQGDFYGAPTGKCGPADSDIGFGLGIPYKSHPVSMLGNFKSDDFGHQLVVSLVQGAAGGGLVGLSRANVALAKRAIHISGSRYEWQLGESWGLDLIGKSMAAVGLVIQVRNDQASGRGDIWILGDISGSLFAGAIGGGLAGLLAGEIACGGPEDLVGDACGGIGASIFSGASAGAASLVFHTAYAAELK